MRTTNLNWRRGVPIPWGLGVLVSLGMLLASCGGGPGIGPRQLIAVSVQPGGGQAIAPDGTVPFSATGTFDQAPTSQPNLPVQWASSDSTIATIDPNSGIATCLVVGGPITMTASAAGRGGTVHGSSTLACQLSPDPVVKLPDGLGFRCRATVAGCQCDSPKTATLTNVGGATLIIDGKSTTPPFFLEHTGTCGASVEPGQSCSMHVTFQPSGLGFFSGELTVTDNAADSPQGVPLSAQVDCIP